MYYLILFRSLFFNSGLNESELEGYQRVFFLIFIKMIIFCKGQRMRKHFTEYIINNYVFFILELKVLINFWYINYFTIYFEKLKFSPQMYITKYIIELFISQSHSLSMVKNVKFEIF